MTRRLSDDFLSEVLYTYERERAAMRVAEVYGVSRTTAYGWLQEARRRGLTSEPQCQPNLDDLPVNIGFEFEFDAQLNRLVVSAMRLTAKPGGPEISNQLLKRLPLRALQAEALRKACKRAAETLQVGSEVTP